VLEEDVSIKFEEVKLDAKRTEGEEAPVRRDRYRRQGDEDRDWRE
jgi:hypothetical protein